MEHQEFLTRATEALRAKRFEDFEEVWLAYAETRPQDANTFIAMAEGLVRRGQTPRATTLLSLLATTLEERKDYDRALVVVKAALALRPDDESLRRQLAGVFRRLYPDRPNLDGYIEFSGLVRGVELATALATLERCLLFDEGEHFLHDAWGVGRVTKFDPRRDVVVIDFERSPERELSLANATRFLTRLSRDHFLVLRAEKPDELRRLAGEDPVGLVRNLLASFNRDVSARELKTLLEGIVGEAEWPKWWEGTRRLVEKDPNIRSSGTAAKSYRFHAATESADDEFAAQLRHATFEEKLDLIAERAAGQAALAPELWQSIVRDANARVGTEPALALECFLVAEDVQLDRSGFAFQPAALIARDPAGVLSALRTSDLRRRALDIFVDSDPAHAREILTRALAATTDVRAWDDVARILPDAQVAAVWQEADRSYLTMPVAYVAGLRRFPPEPGFPALSKLLGVAEKHKAVRGRVKEFLKKDEYAFLRATLAGAEPDQRTRFERALMRSTVWLTAERRALRDILVEIDPSFAETEAAAESIYVTRAGRDRAEKELKHLTQVEISKAGTDIAKAAAHGDLSENYEYKAAKERQHRLLDRAKNLEAEIKRLKVIKASDVETARVSVGTRVLLEPEAGGDPRTIDLLGPWDSDPDAGVLSYLAPLAKTLLGHAAGDTVELDGSAWRIASITPSPRL